MTDELSTLADELAETYDIDDDLATDAAEMATEFSEEYELDLTVEEVLEGLEEAPYEGFTRQWNWWIGDLAADIEDCTNSREFRFAGFDDVAAIQ